MEGSLFCAFCLDVNIGCQAGRTRGWRGYDAAIDFGGLEDSWKWLGWIAVLSSQMYLFGKDARLFISSFL